ncbi:hypothetical protein SAMN02745673_00034 [Marinactinospora thermotolerans DSM 45154]|uniref:Uncharacterized protein n=1 Tax=Marinactinospora thermotolerans DSM 45154 TaxID=1122192 RepID=A0A1T4JXA4_9ACTN|nr:hypothetical protein [Marinactinospora thermotolerans]SJZ34754.1 hypothetical protein SAMN02745673_00034 [Marinactinospora thermotolerans DSM 45154]
MTEQVAGSLPGPLAPDSQIRLPLATADRLRQSLDGVLAALAYAVSACGGRDILDRRRLIELARDVEELTIAIEDAGGCAADRSRSRALYHLIASAVDGGRIAHHDAYARHLP